MVSGIRTLGLHENMEALQYRDLIGMREARNRAIGRTTRTDTESVQDADSLIVTMEENQLPRGKVAMRVAMAVLAVLLVCQAISPMVRGLDERCGLIR